MFQFTRQPIGDERYQFAVENSGVANELVSLSI